MKLIKHEEMRKNNALSILLHLREHGPETKRDIQAGTGLSWGAVSNITAILLEQGVVTESRSAQTSVGRTPSLLDINGDTNRMIGIDVNIRGITAVLMDLKGRVHRTVGESLSGNDRDSVLELTMEILRALLRESGTPPEGILGIGVAMQGAVDAAGGVSIYSPYFTGWQDVPLKDLLESEFGLPVMVEHDPNCMALAETWLGIARRMDHMVLIRLSMGIGMSIMINHEIYTGADGSAGEFGHLMMDIGGEPCSCGNRGCLEVCASGRGILRQARNCVKAGSAWSGEPLDEDNEANLAAVAAAARQGDACMRGIFDRAGVCLGTGIANLINLLNPQLVVLGGELARYEDLLVDKAREVAAAKAWRHARVHIVSSKLGSDAAAVGAATLFVQKYFLGETANPARG